MARTLHTAETAQQDGDYDEALKDYEQAIDLWKQHPPESLEVFTDTLFFLGTLSVRKADYKKAEELLNQVLKARKARFGDDDPQTAQILMVLGEIHHKQGRFARAREEYLAAIKVFEKAGVALVVTALRTALAELEARWGVNSDPPFDAAAAMRNVPKVFGPDNAMTTEQTDYAAHVARLRALPEVAERGFILALEIGEKIRPAGLEARVSSLYGLGEVQLTRENYDLARGSLTASRDLAEKLNGPGHPDAARCLFALGRLAEKESRLADALGHVREARRIYESVYKGLNHPDLAEILEAEAKLLRGLKMDAEADPLEKRAAGMRTAHARENPKP